METAKERLTPAGFKMDWKRRFRETTGQGVQAVLREWLGWLATPGAQAIAQSRGWL